MKQHIKIHVKFPFFFLLQIWRNHRNGDALTARYVNSYVWKLIGAAQHLARVQTFEAERLENKTDPFFFFSPLFVSQQPASSQSELGLQYSIVFDIQRKSSDDWTLFAVGFSRQCSSVSEPGQIMFWALRFLIERQLFKRFLR